MQNKEIVFFGIVSLALVTCIYLVFLLTSETSQCIQNPYLYGAGKMKNIECNCQQFSNALCPAQFYFNDTAFLTPVTECLNENSVYSKINLSGLDELIGKKQEESS